MPLFSFHAADVRWQQDAHCNGVDYDFTPDVETSKGLAFARDWCRLCPVRTECLAYALLYRMSGYWGGTDTAERRLLGYARDRVKCPDCGCKALVTTAEGHEICQACGMSWTAASRSRLPEGAAG